LLNTPQSNEMLLILEALKSETDFQTTKTLLADKQILQNLKVNVKRL